MSIQTVTINYSQYTRIRLLEETHFVDLKSKDIKPAKLTQTIAAFANADGGELYIGITENTEQISARERFKSRQWLGFKNQEAANSHIQVFDRLFPLGQEFSYEFLSYGSESLVLHIEVKRTRNIKRASNDKVYIRLGASNKVLESEEELNRLKMNKGLVSFEEEITCAHVLDIANSEPILKFLSDNDISSEPEVWLKKHRLIYEGKPTVCGVLLFAELPQAILPKRCGIKIYRYKTDDPEGVRETLAFHPLTIEGHIYLQIKQAVNKTVEIVENIPKLGHEGLEKILYPRETLHEIITNAVLHRDYSIADDIHIRIFDNRVEVESPGALPGHITVKNILEERFSRNGNLVQIINKFPDPPNKDIGEGLNTAFQAMQKLRLKEPEIKQMPNKVIVYIRHESLGSPESIIMKYLAKNSFITKAIARKISHCDTDYKLDRLLKRLVERNMIERVPEMKGKKSAYRRKEES